MSDVTPPQAGWYKDPENPAGERWWNGSGWSDQKRAATVDAGFTFGSPTTETRPDPYAAQTYPAPPAYNAPAYTAPAYTAPAYTPASPYVAAPYGAPARSNGLAIAGLIVSAGGWIFLGAIASIAGIILSAFGLARAKQAEAAGNPNSGRGIALAGLIIGIVVTVLGILFFVVYLVFVFSTFPAETFS